MGSAHSPYIAKTLCLGIWFGFLTGLVSALRATPPFHNKAAKEWGTLLKQERRPVSWAPFGCWLFVYLGGAGVFGSAGLGFAVSGARIL